MKTPASSSGLPSGGANAPVASRQGDFPPRKGGQHDFPPSQRGAMSFGTRFAHGRLTAMGGCQDGRRKASQRAGGSAAGYTDDSADAAPARSAAQRGNRARSCWQSAAVLRPVPESAAAVLLHSGAEELARL